ncbi:MAG: hypothetical protein IT433_12895 [Phycisphaerales bacterium]|nr:hypothetical protein [Phycisphaerales bacterium]
MGVNAGIDIQSLQTEVIQAARTKVAKNFKETAEYRKYTVQELLLGRAVTESEEHGFEWTVRIKSAAGSTGMVDAFEKVTYQRDDYGVRCKATPRTVVSHKNVVIDKLAEMIGNGAVDKVYSAYKMMGSAAEEELARTWESKLTNPPQSVSAKDGIMGLLYHARRSMTSGGVFVAQTTPARNGVYYRDGAGTVASDMYTVADISAAAYSRLRTLVGTHGGVMNDTLLNTVYECVKQQRFEFLPTLKGETSKVDTVVLWDDVFDSQYDQLLTALGAPRKRDYFETGETTVKGTKTMAVPFWNGHTLRPIIGVNLAELKFRKSPGNWGKQYMEQLTHRSNAYPVEWTGQMWAENPQSAIFLIHGSFSTGT